MANQWFRVYAEFTSDPKVQMMSEANQRRFVMLLCLRCNGDVTLHDEEIAFQLRIGNEEWSATKALFIDKGFIDSSNKVLNWDKRQFISDSSAARVAKHRTSKKQLCNVTVTPPDTETETETETETDIKALSILPIDPANSDSVKTKCPKEKNPAVLEIFNYWKSITNHKAAKLDVKREKVIGDALKIGYSVDELRAAILGCSKTPFNCGDNDRQTRFDGLGIIFKNADQIDRFIQNSIQPVPAKQGLPAGEKKYKVLN